MWDKTSYSVKCTRSDCKNFQMKADNSPCVFCTCNNQGEGSNRSFKYQPIKMPKLKEEVKDNDNLLR